MQKLPEVPDRKKGWCMRKEKKKRKKATSWQRGTGFLSLSGSERRINNTIFPVWCLSTTHTSLDVALVSPFHPGAHLSRSTLCWNIKDPQMNYKLKQPDFDKLPKETSPYGSPKYQMRTNICMKRLTYFWHLNWGIQPFQCIQEKLPHPWNGCWT